MHFGEFSDVIVKSFAVGILANICTVWSCKCAEKRTETPWHLHRESVFSCSYFFFTKAKKKTLCRLLTVCHKHKSFTPTMHSFSFHTHTRILYNNILKCVVFDLSCLAAFASPILFAIILLLLSLFNPVTGIHTHTLRMKFMAHHNNNNVTKCRKERVGCSDVAGANETCEGGPPNTKTYAISLKILL